MECDTKNSKARCDIALQPVTLRPGGISPAKMHITVADKRYLRIHSRICAFYSS
jgi:hypothetical protein